MSKLVEEIKVYGDLLRGFSFEVVNLHPLADEDEVLRNLDMTSDECVHCDLYWAFQKKQIFVSIACSPLRDPVAVYYYKDGVKNGYSFSVATQICPLSTKTVENILNYLSNWIAENMEILDQKEKVKETIRITGKDIAAGA